MKITVRVKSSAIKDLKKIDSNWQNKILQLLENISEKDIKNSKKLQGLNKDLYRIRINDYRLIFDLETDKSIHVLRILHRQSAYKHINNLK